MRWSQQVDRQQDVINNIALRWIDCAVHRKVVLVMSGKTYLYLEEDVDTLVVVGVEILVEVDSEDDVDAELEELKGD